MYRENFGPRSWMHGPRDERFSRSWRLRNGVHYSLSFQAWNSGHKCDGGRHIRVTCGAAVKLGPHGDVSVPTRGVDTNKPRDEHGEETIRLHRVPVPIATELLGQKTIGTQLTHQIQTT